MNDRTILVVVDPTATEEQPVVARSAWLAARTDARLELCIADFDAQLDAGAPWGPALPRPRDSLLETHRDKLEALAGRLRSRGLRVDVHVKWDHPLSEALLRIIEARRPWLVAKDTRYHGPLKRTLLSNTDWDLIRACPVPLLLVKPRTLAGRPKVFAAVDPLHEHDKPGRLNDAIYGIAAELAAAIGGELHVVHSCSPPMGLELPADVAQQLADQHRQAFAEFLLTHPVPEGNARLLPGPPAESLTAAAEELGADLMVMGAVSRRGLTRWFIGSTAERVLDRLPCDLVIVKP
jgi:universal stress protein E